MAAGVGESEEFVALREYRRGDSLRRVHWRSAARRGELIVKEYQDEYFVRHALVLDTFCEASRDALFEEAVAVAASFACTVPDQDSLLDLLFVGPKTVTPWATTSSSARVRAQLPPFAAARSTITEPGFMLATVSASISSGARAPGTAAVEITASASFTRAPSSSRCFARNSSLCAFA